MHPTELPDCTACDGSGIGSGHKMGGICQKCGGSGKQKPPKPAEPAPRDKTVWRNGAKVRS